MKALVVSNVTLEGDEVFAVLEQHRTERDLDTVHVVVPISLRDRYPWEAAKERMDSALTRMKLMGLEATGVLGDNDPYLALRNALEMGLYDRVLISTLRRDASRWLRMDLISRAERLTEIPVEGITTAVG